MITVLNHTYARKDLIVADTLSYAPAADPKNKTRHDNFYQGGCLVLAGYARA